MTIPLGHFLEAPMTPLDAVGHPPSCRAWVSEVQSLPEQGDWQLIFAVTVVVLALTMRLFMFLNLHKILESTKEGPVVFAGFCTALLLQFYSKSPKT